MWAEVMKVRKRKCLDSKLSSFQIFVVMKQCILLKGMKVIFFKKKSKEIVSRVLISETKVD